MQMFCSHAIVQGYKIPMASAFLEGKSERHYRILFLILRAKSLEKFHEDFPPDFDTHY